MAVAVGCWPNANAANSSRPCACFFLPRTICFYFLDGPHATLNYATCQAPCGPVRPHAAPLRAHAAPCGSMQPHAAPCGAAPCTMHRRGFLPGPLAPGALAPRPRRPACRRLFAICLFWFVVSSGLRPARPRTANGEERGPGPSSACATSTASCESESSELRAAGFGSKQQVASGKGRRSWHSAVAVS
jgi:hypothetical protein